MGDMNEKGGERGQKKGWEIVREAGDKNVVRNCVCKVEYVHET